MVDAAAVPPPPEHHLAIVNGDVLLRSRSSLLSTIKMSDQVRPAMPHPLHPSARPHGAQRPPPRPPIPTL